MAQACSWPRKCGEPAETTFGFLSYCFEHGVDVENQRGRMLAMTPAEWRKAVIAALYDKEDNPFRPIDVSADRAARAAEQEWRRKQGASRRAAGVAP